MSKHTSTQNLFFLLYKIRASSLWDAGYLAVFTHVNCSDNLFIHLFIFLIYDVTKNIKVQSNKYASILTTISRREKDWNPSKYGW